MGVLADLLEDGFEVPAGQRGQLQVFGRLGGVVAMWTSHGRYWKTSSQWSRASAHLPRVLAMPILGRVILTLAEAPQPTLDGSLSNRFRSVVQSLGGNRGYPVPP